MINYDDFFKSCKTKVEHLDERVVDAALMCASEYYLYFRKGDTLITTDQDGVFLFDQPVPLDCDLFVEKKIIQFYHEQINTLMRAQKDNQTNVSTMTTAFTKKWKKLFCQITMELFNQRWNDDEWDVDVDFEAVQLQSKFGTKIRIPASWFTKNQEEIKMLLSMTERIRYLNRHDNLDLPDTMYQAWVWLQHGQHNLHDKLPPEICTWVDDDGVPHVVVLGLTEHGEKGKSISSVYKKMIPTIASNMPYKGNLQDRMFDILIYMCKNKEDSGAEVARLIPDKDIRQKFTKTLQAIQSS